ncbi:A/G-specific adenine glycosylase [Nakamurella flavida]
MDDLLQFYADHRRDLPWRAPGVGGWPVLISEVMLQQTPVARVLPVYLEWVARWPTPADLAADAPGDAVRAWGRLGYPRRALRLHAAATALVQRFGGVVPDTVEELLSLPGVGEYTARAVAAFAFGRREPVVDTNVLRVLSRVVRGVDTQASATAADRREMAALLPQDAAVAAVLSVAVMEFGALVCTSRSPGCDGCPVRPDCAWWAAGRPPPTVRRKAQGFAGTDRQVRGLIVGALRAGGESVSEDDLATLWPDPVQWRRCLDSLIVDGLAVPDGSGRITLPR